MWWVVATCLGCCSEVRVGSAAVLVPGAELRSIGVCLGWRWGRMWLKLALSFWSPWLC